jgi:hypothetical protein
MYVKKLFQFDVYLPIPHSSYQDPGVHKHDSGFGDSRRHNTCLDRRFPFRLHDRRQRLTNFMSKQTNFSLKLYFSIVSLVAILASALSLSIYYLAQPDHRQYPVPEIRRLFAPGGNDAAVTTG